MQTAITQAVLVEPDLFFTASDQMIARVGLDRKLLGVPVVVRALRQLQDAGISRSTVLVSDHAAALSELIANDPRITHEVSVKAISDDIAPELKALAVDCDEGLALCRADLVAPAGVLQGLLHDIQADTARVLIGNPDQIVRERRMVDNDGDWRIGKLEPPKPRLIGALALSAKAVDALADRGGELAEALNALSEDDRLETRPIGENWAVAVYEPKSAQQAEKRLLHALRKPIDGLIATSINRNLSIPISRVLANTFITPNMASAFTLILAAVAVWMLTQAPYATQGGQMSASYWWMLLAAFVFQWASIIDGVDGELARLKYQFTKYGEWVDTVIDDISNYSFFIALTWLAYVTGESNWTVAFGVVNIVCYTFFAPLMYAYIIKYTDSGDVMAIDFKFDKNFNKTDDSLFVKVMSQVRKLAKRDFFIFAIFVFAVFGILPKFLYVSGSVAVIVLLTVLNQHRKKRAELATEAKTDDQGDGPSDWDVLTRQPENSDDGSDDDGGDAKADAPEDEKADDADPDEVDDAKADDSEAESDDDEAEKPA